MRICYTSISVFFVSVVVLYMRNIMEGCYFQQEGEEASERSLYHQKNLSHEIAGLKVLNPYAVIMHTSCHIKFQDIETYML